MAPVNDYVCTNEHKLQIQKENKQKKQKYACKKEKNFITNQHITKNQGSKSPISQRNLSECLVFQLEV